MTQDPVSSMFPTSSTAPSPLVDAKINLASFPWAPVHWSFLTSHPLALEANAEPFRALVLLIANAWRLQPTGSLPNDPRQLANFAGFGRDVTSWKTISEAVLSDWILASDQRWYHPEVAAWVNNSWDMKLKADARAQQQSENGKKSAAKRLEERRVHQELIAATRTDGSTQTHQSSNSGSTTAQLKESESRKEKILKKSTPTVKREENFPSPAISGILGTHEAYKQEAFKAEIKEDFLGNGKDAAAAVFEHWQLVTDYTNTTLSKSRRSIIETRLEEGITPEDLCLAASVAARDPFFQGQTARRQGRSDTIEVIFKTADTVLGLVNQARHSKHAQINQMSPAAQGTAASLKSVFGCFGGSEGMPTLAFTAPTGDMQ